MRSIADVWAGVARDIIANPSDHTAQRIKLASLFLMQYHTGKPARQTTSPTCEGTRPMKGDK